MLALLLSLPRMAGDLDKKCCPTAFVGCTFRLEDLHKGKGSATLSMAYAGARLGKAEDKSAHDAS